MKSLTKQDFDKIEGIYGKNIVSYLEKKIVEPQFLEFLKSRAESFQLQGKTLNLNLVDDFIFDLGGKDALDSLIIAILDPEKNEPLHDYLSKVFGYPIKKESTGAALCIYKRYDKEISREVGANVYSYHEYVLVLNSREGKDRGTYVVGKNGLCTHYYSAESITALKKKEKFDNLIPSSTNRIFGLYDVMPFLDNEKWDFARLEPLRFMPKTTLNNVDRMFSGGEYLIAGRGSRADIVSQDDAYPKTIGTSYAHDVQGTGGPPSSGVSITSTSGDGHTFGPVPQQPQYSGNDAIIESCKAACLLAETAALTWIWSTGLPLCTAATSWWSFGLGGAACIAAALVASAITVGICGACLYGCSKL